MGKATLVIGGAGFIGSHLVEALLAGGHSVRVYDNLCSGYSKNLDAVRGDFQFIEGDIRDLSALHLAAAGTDAIFHLAAITSVPRSVLEPLPIHEVNSTGTLQVLEAARNAGARVIFSSSAAVYGDSDHLPLKESGRADPISPYGVQKLNGEEYLRCYSRVHGVEGVSLRYFNVYGPRQDPKSNYSGVISIFADRAGRGEPLTIHGDGKQTRDFIYVGDVVRANLAAMEAQGADGRAANVCRGKKLELNELAQALIDLTGGRSQIERAEPRQADIRHSQGDPTLAGAWLGFTAETEIEEGLRRLLASLRAHP